MATSTVERRTVRAQVRYVRVSPYKIREVLQLVRGRGVREAEESLALSERDPAQVVAKCLASAVANAEHNDQIEASELFVAECYCDEGPTLKRWRPRARGRATRILKRTSHVTVILGRYTPEELQAIEDREASRGTGGRRRDAGEDRRRRVAKSRGDEVEAEVDEVETDDGGADEGDTEVEDPAAVDDEVVDDEVVDDDVVDDAAPEATDDGDDAGSGGATVDELVGNNSKDELLALAEESGVQVAKSANKATIAEAILAGSDSADEGEA
jgi:large subunit ribosomal protein L22